MCFFNIYLFVQNDAIFIFFSPFFWAHNTSYWFILERADELVHRYLYMYALCHISDISHLISNSLFSPMAIIAIKINP